MGAADLLPAALRSPLALRAFARGWRAKQALSVSEWADANRVLSEVGSAEPGAWKTSRTPYLREIMDQLSETSPAKLVAFMKPSQVGGTEVGSNWLGYIMAHAKGPVAVVMPTEKSLGDWMTQKFEPMAADTPAIAAVLARRSNSEGNNSAQRKKFSGGILYAKTAGSTAELKSTSLRYALADEIDEYPRGGNQGDVLGLLEVRITTFHDGKVYAPSSPTVKEASAIEDLFEGGDQRRYHVPCPHCGHLQVLTWGNLRWTKDPRNARRVLGAHYVCAECGAEIEEHHKPGMLAELGHGGQARWIAGEPGAPYPSYHINALYTPLGLGKTWAELAQQWLDAQDNPQKLVVFVNTRLAETWADRSADIKASVIEQRAEPYPLRTIPQGCLVLTAGVDTQDDRLEIQIRGFGRNGRRWTIDYHVLPGNPADEGLWDRLADYLNAAEFSNAFGRRMKLDATAIDTGGHHTHAVYQFVRSRRVRRCIAVKGASTPGRAILGKPSMQDVNWKGQVVKKGVALYTVGSDVVKHLLYNLLHLDTDKAAEDRKVRFSQQLDTTFFQQLTAEVFNPRKNRWELKKGRRNEALDTWVYAEAASHHPELYVHKWRAADWDRRAAMLEPEAQPEADTAPPQAEPIAAPHAKKPAPFVPRPPGGFKTRTW